MIGLKAVWMPDRRRILVNAAFCPHTIQAKWKIATLAALSCFMAVDNAYLRVLGRLPRLFLPA
jgi:hypothetical protein